MRKKLGLVLAAAVCFDLGVVIVPAHAAGDGAGAGKASVQDSPATQITDRAAIEATGKASVQDSPSFLKLDVLPSNQEYLKIKMVDLLVSSKACLSSKGKLVEFKGTKFCATGKHIPAKPLLLK